MTFTEASFIGNELGKYIYRANFVFMMTLRKSVLHAINSFVVPTSYRE